MDESGKLIGIIGDEDTVTGFLLAGVGHRTVNTTNFLVVKNDRRCVQPAVGEGRHRDHSHQPARCRRDPSRPERLLQDYPHRARNSQQGRPVRSGAGLHHAENQPHAWRGAINGIILRRYTNCFM